MNVSCDKWFAKFRLLSVGTIDELRVMMAEQRLSEERLRRANADLAQRESELRIALGKLEAAHDELKSMQLQLIQSSKLESVGKLAAGVAHEVKNPLQTMLMGLTFLEQVLRQSGEQTVKAECRAQMDHACRDMHEAIDRANTIIRGLLQMSGSPQLRLERLDLNDLAQKSLSFVTYHLNESRVTVQCQLQRDLPRVDLDEGKIEQVFVNLYTNAIHAMPKGGTLRIRTYVDANRPGDRAQTGRSLAGAKTGGGVVVAEVCDSGTGIPEDKIDLLFSPFFTTKKKGLGTGLGLSVTKSIVELHGGQIELNNRPEGGARATLRFQPGKERSL